MNQLLKIEGKIIKIIKVIKRLIDKRIFSISIFSSSFKIWLDLNNGLECESADWKFIILKRLSFVE